MCDKFPNTLLVKRHVVLADNVQEDIDANLFNEFFKKFTISDTI